MSGFSSVRSIALCTVLLGGTARAQDLEPRAYSSVPVGLNFLIVGYGYTEGDISTDASLPIEDAELDQHTVLAGYSHSFALYGQVAKLDLIAPYSWLSGSATASGLPVERDVSGLNDPRLRFTYLFWGAPALDLDEWLRRPEELVVGASLQVMIPTGQYSDERVVNLGNNRWAVKPELGVTKSWGPVSLELSSAATFFQDNRDFVGATREQAPLYSFQAHAVYSLRRSLWLSIDGTYYWGGRTKVDGVHRDDRQSNSRIGLSLSAPLSARQSLKIYASTALSTRTGGDWDAFGVAWQVRWGAGL